MRQTLSSLGILLLAAAMPPAQAVERSSEAEALALIGRAQAYIKTQGMEQAFAEFNKLDSPFNSKSPINPKGDLYLYTVDQKGFQAVHGKNPKIRGKVMIEMQDGHGKYLIREMVKLCFGRAKRGWVDYRWPNPVTGNIELKQGYVERIPGTDICLGTGIYK